MLTCIFSTRTSWHCRCEFAYFISLPQLSQLYLPHLNDTTCTLNGINYSTLVCGALAKYAMHISWKTATMAYLQSFVTSLNSGVGFSRSAVRVRCTVVDCFTVYHTRTAENYSMWHISPRKTCELKAVTNTVRRSSVNTSSSYLVVFHCILTWYETQRWSSPCALHTHMAWSLYGWGGVVFVFSTLRYRGILLPSLCQL